MKNITAIILILATVGIFFGFIKPTWGSISVLKTEEKTYDEALEKASTLEKQITVFQAKLNALNTKDVERVNKMIPDSIDNIKLIIDINNIAKQFGMDLKDIKVTQQKAAAGGDSEVKTSGGKTYETVDIAFNVASSYQNFISFLQGLEKSLRLVDVTSVSLKPDDKSSIFTFTVSLRTYWLK